MGELTKTYDKCKSMAFKVHSKIEMIINNSFTRMIYLIFDRWKVIEVADTLASISYKKYAIRPRDLP